MSVFDAGDIVQFAIRIEENGENFYRYAIQIARDEDTKLLFANLADEEVHHRRFFEKLFASLGKYTPPPEGYEGEYDAYLRDYVDNNIIFTSAVLERELTKITSVPSALDFAIRREVDSIFYYSEIKRLIAPAEQGAIEEVIDEERRHFAKLSTARQRYA